MKVAFMPCDMVYSRSLISNWLVGVSNGDVLLQLRGVGTNWNSSWGNNYIRF